MSAAYISRSGATASVSPRRRIESIDIVRGIIMILMALDHTRDYFGNAAVNPTDPATTTVWLFFTRWVTHICAPGFFLLTGVGASLTLHRMSKGELSRFLFTRGLWLLFLEIVIVRCFGWQFNFDYRLMLLNVL
ncbi:MAG: heparan-alpha-glucosaminide N-acetyltransferase domain-containing protein, partial [Gemmatimonadaceae bacterium]